MPGKVVKFGRRIRATVSNRPYMRLLKKNLEIEQDINQLLKAGEFDLPLLAQASVGHDKAAQAFARLMERRPLTNPHESQVFFKLVTNAGKCAALYQQGQDMYGAGPSNPDRRRHHSRDYNKTFVKGLKALLEANPQRCMDAAMDVMIHVGSSSPAYKTAESFLNTATQLSTLSPTRVLPPDRVHEGYSPR